MTKQSWILLGGGALIATSFQIAGAQEGNLFQRDRYENVRDRYQEDFDPESIRLGAFVVNSNLELGAEANDNVFADNENEESDIIVRIVPTLDARSDWSRNELGGRFVVRHREYTDLDSESATDLRGELRGRIDVTRAFDLSGAIFASDEFEERRSVANLDVFEEPVNFQTLGGRAAARFQRDRIRLNADYQVTDYQYDDVPLVGGGSFDLDERNYNFQQVRGRLSYAISPDFAVFGQASGSTRDYEEEVLIDGEFASRDADGYALQVGADFELPVLIRGDVAIGYLEDTKDSDVFADVSGLSLQALVEWFPTRLTTVTFDASRNVIDPGLATAGSATATDYGVRVDHELFRNWLLFGAAGLRERDYEDIDRDDELLDLRIGATWKLNKRFHLDGYVSRFDRDSTVDAGDFEQNLIGLALRIHP